MIAIICKTPDGLQIFNFENENQANRIKLMYKWRNLTVDEKALFVDGLEYAGGEKTSIKGGSLASAVISYTPKTHDEILNTTIERLTERFQKARDSGTTVDFGTGPIPVATTHEAQQEIAAMVKRLSGGGTQRAATRSGIVIEWTEALAQIALDAVENHMAACYTNEADLTEVIQAAADPSTVNIDAGWP